MNSFFTVYRKGIISLPFRKSALYIVSKGLTQEGYRPFRFPCKSDGIVDGLPVNVHQPGTLVQPVVVKSRYFDAVSLKITDQPVCLILKDSGFAQAKRTSRSVKGLERKQLVPNQRRSRASS